MTFAIFFAAAPTPDDSFPVSRHDAEPVTVVDNAELIARLRMGDERAFAAVVHWMVAPLTAYALAFVHTREIAQELVQDVLAELWERRETLTPTGTLERHLFGAIRFRALHVLRRRRLEEQYQQRTATNAADMFMTEPLSPDMALERADLYAAAIRAASALPPRALAVFRLRWGEGLSYLQISQRLGISVKGAEIQMTRALKTIRERLGR